MSGVEEIMVTVPLSTFEDGIMAKADLDSIRALICEGGEYCSDGIRAVLGITADKSDKTDDTYDNPTYGED